MQFDFEIYFILFLCIILFVCLVLFGLYLFNKNIKNIKESAHEKQQMQTRFTEELLQTQMEIQEQTFKNISQEIHDNVGQVLTIAKLHLSAFPVVNDEQVDKVKETRGLIGKALDDLRNLSHSMHGDRIAALGLLKSLETELVILENTKQFDIQLQTAGTSYSLHPQKEMVIFRIVQECLNNAVKHSHAKRITVEVHYKPDVFSLIISDDGKGFDLQTLQSSEAGLGLQNMQNRATLIGGYLTIHSTYSTGTKISFEIKNNE